MSKASAKAPAVFGGDAVLDFLYYDAPRIGSYLAQVDDAGHLQQVTQSETVSKTAKRGYALKAGVTLPAIPGVTTEGAEGTIGFDRSPGDVGAETGQRVYDPQWTNARSFLDHFEQEGLIQRNLKTARMGQLIWVDCDLWVMDMSALKSLLEVPALKAIVSAQMVSDGNVDGVVALEILPTLHLGVQVRMKSDGNHLWGTVNPRFLSIQTGDLLLKHGVRIAGEWTAVGILDAFPDSTLTPPPSNFEGFALALEHLGKIRDGAGRPATSYGMTPLLIFRQVSGLL